MMRHGLNGSPLLLAGSTISSSLQAALVEFSSQSIGRNGAPFSLNSSVVGVASMIGHHRCPVVARH